MAAAGPLVSFCFSNAGNTTGRSSREICSLLISKAMRSDWIGSDWSRCSAARALK